jgi:aspartyl-tRNA(Asn)/glutamyl-tRNA(Gln) amidotransferase subunit C
VKGQEKVQTKDVLHVAALANLELTPAEQSRLVTDLNAVLDHIDMLNEVDTADVPPTAAVAGDSTALREDETRPSLPREEALGNAAETGASEGKAAFFRVPKVIER